jgi:hypothetical protein
MTNNMEPAKRATALANTKLNRDDPSVARSAGLNTFSDAYLGVPLRFTPGFMLTPASRVGG